jgi:hypothetical protein
LKASFQTLSIDLVEFAEAARGYFENLGYTIKVEPSELGYPKTPAFRCTRNHTTIIVEVCEKPNITVIKEWVALGHSTGGDLRISICIPKSAQGHLAKCQEECQSLGVGVYVATATNVQEWVPPQDLGLQLHLPSLSGYPKKVRKALGAAYEQFGRRQWREGFEEACKALEQRARLYLKQAIQRGRLKIYNDKGLLDNPSAKKINKMPLGALAESFSKAQPQNATDALIQKTLSSVNPDRVGVAHKINQIKTEKSLRKNVGVHMHAIVQALKHIA